jgi:hypothetical protein
LWLILAGFLFLSLLGHRVLAQDAPGAATPRNSEPSITETETRSVFAKAALFSGPIPHWSAGYLVTKTTESFSAATPNVTVFARDGSKAGEKLHFGFQIHKESSMLPQQSAILAAF